MIKQNKNTKKQHWIPQFYLRCFSDAHGGLHAYNSQSDKFYPTNTRDTCSSNYLYEVPRSQKHSEDGTRFLQLNRIENQLSRTEHLLAQSYSKLIHSCEHGKLEGEDFEDGRLSACYLFACMTERHPLAIEDRRTDLYRFFGHEVKRFLNLNLVISYLPKKECSDDEFTNEVHRRIPA